MKLTAQIAKHLRDVYFGGNWTSVNLKTVLEDVTWQQATTKVHGLNTIVTLVYHVHYYVALVSQVLKGGPLDGKDAYSFQHPPITSEEEWQGLLQTAYTAAEQFVNLIEGLPDEQLGETFVDPKYGTYYRNLQGIVEHTHYHLGQIALIKKMVQAS